MDKKIFLLCILFVLWFNASAVFALDPIGPPAAGLRKGQFSFGSEYSYSRMDVELNSGKGSWYGFTDGMLGNSNFGKMSSATIEHMTLQKVYANFGYGVTDSWEMFLRLGAGHADFGYKDDTRPFFSVPVSGPGGILFPDGQKADGDSGFAIGFGSKVTFYRDDKLKLGGLFQISWLRSDGKRSGLHPAGGGVNAYPGPASGIPWSHSVNIEIKEIQIAAGPEYQLTERISIYGGPFFHQIDGEVDGRYIESGNFGMSTLDYRAYYDYDISENSIFGGFVGTQIEVFENALFNIEYQHTAFADALTMGLVWIF